MENKALLFSELEKIQGIRLLQECDFQKQTTLKLSEKNCLILIDDISAVNPLLQKLKELEAKFCYLGLGSNQVIDPHIDCYVKMNIKYQRDFFDYFGAGVSEAWLPSSLPITIMTQWAIKNNLKGWEVISGIPASLGGAIFMNAGTGLGEIASLVKSVRYIDFQTGKMVEKKIDRDIDFSYRHNNFLKKNDLIVEVQICHLGAEEGIALKIKNYLEYRTKTQPLWSRNSGCTFKNIKEFNLSAGKILDAMGLKGLTRGGMTISYKHANFFENLSNASREDMLTLIHDVQELVFLSTGIKLEVEINI